MKFILIFATGRSASTTLQRLIDTIPNSNITGEKWGSIINLLECYKNIKKTTEYTPKDKQTSIFSTKDKIDKYNIKPCFYNCFNFIDVKNNIKNTIISILNNNKKYKVLGYKEIRWFNNLHLLDEFLELFPNTKIICHIQKDVKKQALSGWWKEQSNAQEHLLGYNKKLINYYNTHDNCYLSYKTKLFVIDEIKKLFIFLEEPFDENKYLQIINNNRKKIYLYFNLI